MPIVFVLDEPQSTIDATPGLRTLSHAPSKSKNDKALQCAHVSMRAGDFHIDYYPYKTLKPCTATATMLSNADRHYLYRVHATFIFETSGGPVVPSYASS